MVVTGSDDSSAGMSFIHLFQHVVQVQAGIVRGAYISVAWPLW